MTEPLGPGWLRVEDVAKLLGIRPGTVRTYAARDQMPAPSYVGRTPVWRREVIEEWARNRPRKPLRKEGAANARMLHAT